MNKIYRVWWYEGYEDAYGFPKTRKAEKFFNTLEKAESFKEEKGKNTFLEEIEVE